MMQSSELIKQSPPEITLHKESEKIHGLFDEAFSAMESQMRKYSAEEIEAKDLQAAWYPFGQEFKTFLVNVYRKLYEVGTEKPDGKEYNSEGYHVFYEYDSGLEQDRNRFRMVLRSLTGEAVFRMEREEVIILSRPFEVIPVNNIEMFSENGERVIEIEVRDGLLKSMTHTTTIGRRNRAGRRPSGEIVRQLSFW